MHDKYKETHMHAGLERGANLAAIFQILRGKWLWITGTSVLCAVLLGIYSLRLPKIYAAESLVSIVEDPATGGSSASGAARLGAIASAVGVNLSGSEGHRAEYIALLSSRRLIADLITSNNLLVVLYASRWDDVMHSWKKVWYSSDAPTIDSAINYFRTKILEVAEDKRTGLVSIKIEWRDSQQAARWTNLLVTMVNDYVRKTTISEANRTIDFLNKELIRTTEIQVRDSIYRLMETNLSRIALANVQEQYALKNLDPARPADLNQNIRPRPLLAFIGGLMLGLLASVGIFLWCSRRTWLVGDGE